MIHCLSSQRHNLHTLTEILPENKTTFKYAPLKKNMHFEGL